MQARHLLELSLEEGHGHERRSDAQRSRGVLRLDWNALRPGDHVMVHHTTDDGAPHLVAGAVVSVTAAGGSNDVAVRIAGGRGTRVVHPSRLSVHHDPIEFDGHCWRCTSGDTPAARR